MINKTKTYWTGDDPEDIKEYLRLYSDNNDLLIKPVVCHTCGSNTFMLNLDQDEDAIEVECSQCNTKKLLLDSEDVWEDADPKVEKCPICKGKEYNVQVGFSYRENGCVDWIYIGNRCCKCQTLGSYLDWGIDYEPTDELEENL